MLAQKRANMIKGNIVKFRNIFIAFLLFFITNTAVLAEQASVDFSITLPEYIQIQTVTNAVLIANITDRTGNLFAPITSRFRVISNSDKTKTLYLKYDLTNVDLHENVYNLLNEYKGVTPVIVKCETTGKTYKLNLFVDPASTLLQELHAFVKDEFIKLM